MLEKIQAKAIIGCLYEDIVLLEKESQEALFDVIEDLFKHRESEFRLELYCRILNNTIPENKLSLSFKDLIFSINSFYREL